MSLLHCRIGAHRLVSAAARTAGAATLSKATGRFMLSSTWCAHILVCCSAPACGLECEMAALCRLRRRELLRRRSGFTCCPWVGQSEVRCTTCLITKLNSEGEPVPQKFVSRLSALKVALWGRKEQLELLEYNE